MNWSQTCGHISIRVCLGVAALIGFWLFGPFAKSNDGGTSGTPQLNDPGSSQRTMEGPPQALPNRLGRLSTRAFVGTGSDVLVSSFGVMGNATKRVLVRALGSSLTGVSLPLADPTLELRDATGALLLANNNWRDSQEAEIIATGHAPTNNLESAVLVTIPQGTYTAIVAGNNNGTGVGMAEIFDVDTSPISQLTTISSRAFAIAGGDDNAIVGGFTIDGPQSQIVLVRGLGPTLPFPNVLQNPTLELRNGSGNALVFNNDWRDTQAAQLNATGLAPTDPRESAILATLLPGSYTVVLADPCNNLNGVALVEVYGLGLSDSTDIPPSSTLCGPTPVPPTITSPLAVTGTVGVRFTYQFEASQATSLTVTNLPPGLTFAPALSAIIGNPTAAGTFAVGLRASNIGGAATGMLTITVQATPPAGPVIISSSAATGRVGQPFVFRVYTSGGTPAATLSTSNLPPGLRTDAVTGVTGLISGTPTVAGSSSVTLIVTDGNFTTSSTLQLTFTADPARPVIASPISVTLVSGQFFSYTIVAPSSDPSDPVSFSYAGNLPGGLNFDPATGVISGIPAAPPDKPFQGGGPANPELAGGALLGSIQLFATNGHGTSTLPLAFLPPSIGVVNISTRLLVQTDANVLIGGFIITGNAPKIVVIRAIGPSTGLPGALVDPTLELHDSANHIVSNDNWRDTQQDLIIATYLAPTDNNESVILIGLDPGNYTAIVAGKNNSTGIALVEAYDLRTGSLDISGNAKLANISTRGFVDTGNNVMIGGFIISGQATRVIGRAIGPSLTQFGIPDALADPTLELRDSDGGLLVANNNWQDDPTMAAELTAAGLAPTDQLESGLVANLNPGNYTAIVRGNPDNTIGVGLVEAYAVP